MDEIKIHVGEGSDSLALKAAFRKLAKGVTDDHDAVMHLILNSNWGVYEYKRDWPDPERIPTGDQTLKDLHQLCLDVVRKQGARELMKLFDTYKIVSLNDLPVNRFVDFYHDAFTAYNNYKTDKEQ